LAHSATITDNASPYATGGSCRSHGALALCTVWAISNPRARITLRSHALNMSPYGSRGLSTGSDTNSLIGMLDSDA
jgi:hypothetical protein